MLFIARPAERESATMPLYVQEFPWFAGISPPELPPDFEDHSWHNDATPSWFSAARRCRLWFFHPDPEEREPGHDVRYVLVLEGEDGEWERVLAQTDEWETVIAALPDLPPS